MTPRTFAAEVKSASALHSSEATTALPRVATQASRRAWLRRSTEPRIASPRSRSPRSRQADPRAGPAVTAGPSVRESRRTPRPLRRSGPTAPRSFSNARSTIDGPGRAAFGLRAFSGERLELERASSLGRLCGSGRSARARAASDRVDECELRADRSEVRAHRPARSQGRNGASVESRTTSDPRLTAALLQALGPFRDPTSDRMPKSAARPAQAAQTRHKKRAISERLRSSGGAAAEDSSGRCGKRRAAKPPKARAQLAVRVGSGQRTRSSAPTRSVAAPHSSPRNGGDMSKLLVFGNAANGRRISTTSTVRALVLRLENGRSIPPSHLLRRSGARARRDHRRVRARPERAALRKRCGDGHLLRIDAHDSAPGECSGGRRARRLRRRASVGFCVDNSAERLEPHQARQQRAPVPVADPGAVLQGRRRRGALELHLDTDLSGVRGRSDHRCQGSRCIRASRFAQRCVHADEHVFCRAVRHDERCGRSRRRLFRHDVEQGDQAAERDDGALRCALAESRLGPRQRGRIARSIHRRPHGRYESLDDWTGPEQR